MKKLIFILAAFVSFSIVGCKSGNDPKSVLESFVEALANKDIKKAKTFATKDSESMLGMMEMGMNMAKDSTKNEYDKSNMEFGDAVITGDKATVPVKNKKSGETTNYALKKEDGKWKVAFDKNTVMQMGQEKMGTNGASEMGNDSLPATDTSLDHRLQDTLR